MPLWWWCLARWKMLAQVQCPMFGIVKGHQTLLQGKKYFKGNIINGTFLLLVVLVIRGATTGSTNSGFVMMSKLLSWRHQEKVCNWKAHFVFFMANVGRNIFHPRWGYNIKGSWFFLFQKTKVSPHKSFRRLCIFSCQ